MVKPSGDKHHANFIAAVLVLVIFGTYVLVLADPPDTVEIGGKRLSPIRVFDQFDQSDWLAENNDRSNGVSSSSLWNGLFRELMSAVMQSTDDYLTMFSVQTVKADGLPNSKNTIQIKLRI